MGRRIPHAKDAEEALAKVLDQVHTGAFADPGRMTVGEYLEQWLDGIRPSLREKTALSYDDTLRGYVIPRVGALRLVDLTATRLRASVRRAARVRSAWLRRPVAAVGGYTHRIVSHALKDAMRAGLLARNPAAIVHPPRATKPDAGVDRGTAWRFLTARQGGPPGALWALLSTTGLRRGEALGLRWGDVDVKRGRVTIRQAVLAWGTRSTSPSQRR